MLLLSGLIVLLRKFHLSKIVSYLTVIFFKIENLQDIMNALQIGF